MRVVEAVSVQSNFSGFDALSENSNLVATRPASHSPAAPKKVASNVTPTSNNWRVNEFFEIVGLLEEMSRFGSTSDYFVGKEVKDRAIEILSFVRDSLHIDFPRVLPEGEDCLSFTWETKTIKSFLTIYTDEIESTTLNRLKGYRCVQSLCKDNRIDFSSITQALATTPKAYSVEGF